MYSHPKQNFEVHSSDLANHGDLKMLIHLLVGHAACQVFESIIKIACRYIAIVLEVQLSMGPGPTMYPRCHEENDGLLCHEYNMIDLFQEDKHSSVS